jgi:hypothetical protein
MDHARELAHRAWRRNQESGTPASTKRELAPSVFTGYLERWDLLHEPISEVPVLLPADYRDLALSDRGGLPPAHPWREHMPDW